jgi:hypothetical protein
MLYDNALDDDPIILDDPPYLEIATTICEDEIDKLAIYDETLIHESPILFMNSPNHSLEENYACVENYFYGLQIYYACEIPIFNHDVVFENGTSNLKGESMLLIAMIILVILFMY